MEPARNCRPQAYPKVGDFWPRGFNSIGSNLNLLEQKRVPKYRGANPEWISKGPVEFGLSSTRRDSPRVSAGDGRNISLRTSVGRT